MMKSLIKIIKTLLSLIVGFILIVTSYVYLHPIFGDNPDEESKTRIKNSPNFDGKHFKNLINTNATSVGIAQEKRKIDRVALLKNFIFPPMGKNPSKPLDTLRLKTLKNEEFVWLGHSTILFKTANKTIITDPVFNNASPIPFTFEPFDMTNKAKIEDLPFIDIVLISHDHYDHLDYKAIKKLIAKVGHFYVPLGVKAHLLRWGVPKTKVSEYDWGEESKIDKIKLAFMPSRHFSGRGILNHRQTLWGSWVILSPKIKVYFSGDGGYSPEFAKIGKKFGGFDIAFMEDGAYNESWKDVHMLPEQSVQASIDVKTKVVVPIHWGKFDLSTHKWNEPVQRFIKAMNKHNNLLKKEEQIKIATPKIGENFSLENIPSFQWWED